MGARGSGKTEPAAVADRVRVDMADASDAERRVARALLAEYPAAGLETAKRLAHRAAVSAPTVVRYVARLGFGSYREFQQALRDEITQRRESPLTLRPQYRSDTPVGEMRSAAADLYRQTVEGSFAVMPDADLDAAFGLLADTSLTVTTVGGRFSHVLAEYLHLHLRMMRPRTRALTLTAENAVGYLVDAGRRDVLVVFDYRRHQDDVVQLARRAKRQGVRVVLCTDPWLSPAADVADAVLPAHVEALSPFDSLVPALAVLEVLVAGVHNRLDQDADRRVVRWEHLADGPGRASAAAEQQPDGDDQRAARGDLDH